MHLQDFAMIAATIGPLLGIIYHNLKKDIDLLRARQVNLVKFETDVIDRLARLETLIVKRNGG